MDNNMIKEIECNITGRVQMVMFRDFACRRARRLKLAGTVQNLPNGSVLVVAQGPEEKLLEFIELLKKGSLLSRVEKVRTLWREPKMVIAGFKIIY